MISAVMFDLDGTLVQSEKLKALSYAMAAQRLRRLPEPDERAIEAYREIVGASRDVASRRVMESLKLEPELQPLTAQFGVSEPWEVLSAMRKEIYDEMVADPQVIRDNQWPHTIAFLRVARETGCRTALATMSQRNEALHVLRSLDLEQYLDEVLTREDVTNPKPDPEIYLLAAERLGVEPADCLVIEDSPNGARAGVAAGMNVIAVATPFTVSGLHSSQVVEHTWVVHEADQLVDVVRDRIAEHNRIGH
ncbi:MAG: HAD family phosphatase [Chloroflexi bacterium]|nr:HAD family phosphatase [Chloroflexota bacterium]